MVILNSLRVTAGWTGGKKDTEYDSYPLPMNHYQRITRLHKSTSVSYTHLDVYKRQVLSCLIFVNSSHDLALAQSLLFSRCVTRHLNLNKSVYTRFVDINKHLTE